MNKELIFDVEEDLVVYFNSFNDDFYVSSYKNQIFDEFFEGLFADDIDGQILGNLAITIKL